MYHVLNRRVGRLPLFQKAVDYAAFEKVLEEAYERSGTRILSYCLMPTHWHMILWPRTDGELSQRPGSGLPIQIRHTEERTQWIRHTMDICLREKSNVLSVAT